MSTSQMWNFPSFLSTALGPKCSLQRLRRPKLKCTFGKSPIEKLNVFGKVPNTKIYHTNYLLPMLFPRSPPMSREGKFCCEPSCATISFLLLEFFLWFSEFCGIYKHELADFIFCCYFYLYLSFKGFNS